VRDAEPVQTGEQLVGRGRHGGSGSGYERAARRAPSPLWGGLGWGSCLGHLDDAPQPPLGGPIDEAAPVRRLRLQMQPPFGIASRRRSSPPYPNGCGCSSGVEHDLAKVGVEGSNPFARSNCKIRHLGDFLDRVEFPLGERRGILYWLVAVRGGSMLTCRRNSGAWC
jgi:hypothetical protein